MGFDRGDYFHPFVDAASDPVAEFNKAYRRWMERVFNDMPHAKTIGRRIAEAA